jgi:hypothetical protein
MPAVQTVFQKLLASAVVGSIMTAETLQGEIPYLFLLFVCGALTPSMPQD